MEISEISKRFNDAAKIIAPQSESCTSIKFFLSAYINMWGEYPNIIELSDEGIYLNRDAMQNDMYDFDDDDTSYIEDEDEIPSEYTFESINVHQSLCNLYDYFKNSTHVIRNSSDPIIIGYKLMIFWDDSCRSFFVLQESPQLAPEILDNIVDKKNNDSKTRWFSYVTSTSQGFSETSLKCKKQDIDLKMNYNDDLPHEQIVEFLKSNKSGLVLLNGEPGGGKSTYIRHLMYELKGRKFMVMDASVFSYITDASFIELLLGNKNAVVILEDCETMLADRVTTGNAMLSTLLNLSDGIIGDGLNFKFICTFNAPIGKLDKAIQRKGRMKVKYEFKKLTADKTKALGAKLGFDIPDGVSLTLAEIFNYGTDNGASNNEKKIGFSK